LTCWPTARGRDQAAPTQTQSTLDSWYTTQIRRSGHPRRWNQTHNNNSSSQPTTANQTNEPRRRRGIKVTLNDYLGYEETAAFGSYPGPINTDETLCLVGDNVNSVKTFGTNEKLRSSAVNWRTSKLARRALLRQMSNDKNINT
jgi:hypothetical protein